MKPERISRTAACAAVAAAACFLATRAVPAASPPAPLAAKVLVKGSPLHGTNGLAFDKQDRLYIASLWGNEIVVMDPISGKILQRIGADKGVISPDDLTFGPDGSLYWTSMLGAHVGRLAPDGSVQTQPVAAGPNPITVSADGRVFVGLCFLGDGLFELDPTLTRPPTAITKDPGMLNGFDIGPDGLLYAPVYFEGRVIRANLKSSPVHYETIATGLAVPSAVKFDSRGLLYGLSQLSGELWVLDPATGRKATITRLPPGIDNLAFDSRDRPFVSHSSDGTIWDIILGMARTVSPGGMILPGGVAVIPRSGGESIFVADAWTLREFDGQTGKALSAQYSSFAVPDGITQPFTASADGGNLVISSWVGSNVQVWNPDTRQVVENYPGLAAPIDAVRFQGAVVASELGTHSVIRLTPAGRTTLTDALFVPSG
ncbi:MAG: hypothetical protein LAQ69_43485, partial [Acidobacteriia bacterium]|nr:hypothetical protein [Terriglobia bacterium]